MIRASTINITILRKEIVMSLLIPLNLLPENDTVHFGEMWPRLSSTRCVILTQQEAPEVANSTTIYQHLLNEYLETIDSFSTKLIESLV